MSIYNDHSELGVLDEIFISEIILDYSSNVTLFGYMRNQVSKKLMRWDFLCGINMLTDMLISEGPKGDTLIKILSEKLSGEIEIPTRIDAENLFGEPLHIDTFSFVISAITEENENGDITQATCYFIEAIQDKNGSLVSLNDISKPLSAEEELQDCYLSLKISYQYYLNLKGQDCTEQEARSFSGLQDSMLFRIAMLQNQFHNN